MYIKFLTYSVGTVNSMLEFYSKTLLIRILTSKVIVDSTMVVLLVTLTDVCE